MLMLRAALRARVLAARGAASRAGRHPARQAQFAFSAAADGTKWPGSAKRPAPRSLRPALAARGLWPRRDVLLSLTSLEVAARAAETAAAAAGGGDGTAAAEASEPESGDATDKDMWLPLPEGWAPPPTRVTAPGRVIALGDLHGDIQKLIDALLLASLIGFSESGIPEWTGGNATLVQVGDIFDRGDAELPILMILLRLQAQAAAAGGAVHLLLGNHELLNVRGDFTDTTEGALLDTAAKVMSPEALTAAINAGNVGQLLYARYSLFSRGGPLARLLSRFSTVLVVNDTVFVHGGLHADQLAQGLESVNAQMSKYLLGVRPDAEMDDALIAAVDGTRAAIWSRGFGHVPQSRAQATGVELASVLAAVPAKRMVIGHTIQSRGIESEFNGSLWRVDVGMSSGTLGRPAQCLAIDGDDVTVLGVYDDAAIAAIAAADLQMMLDTVAKSGAGT